MDVVAALCAALTGLASGAAVLVVGRSWHRLRVRQAARVARIAQIEDAYARDMR